MVGNRIHSRQHVSTSILKSLWCRINKCDIYYTTLRQPNILSIPCLTDARGTEKKNIYIYPRNNYSIISTDQTIEGVNLKC